MSELLNALFARTPTDSQPQPRTAFEPPPQGMLHRAMMAMMPANQWQPGAPQPGVRGMSPGQMLHTMANGQRMGPMPMGVHQDEMSSLFNSVPVGMAKDQGWQGSILGQPVFEPMEMGGMVRRLLPLDRGGRVPPDGSVPIMMRQQ